MGVDYFGGASTKKTTTRKKVTAPSRETAFKTGVKKVNSTTKKKTTTKKTTTKKVSTNTGSKKATNPLYKKYLDSLPKGTPRANAYTQSEFLNRYNNNKLYENGSWGGTKKTTPKKTTPKKTTPKKTTTRKTTTKSKSSGSGTSTTGPTAEEKRASKNLSTIAQFNANSTQNQLKQQLANFDTSDKQNRAFADVQKTQNSRQSAGERFGQQKKLQAATGTVRDAAGNALQGSALGGLADMLHTRIDLDNNAVWSQLTANQNAVENKYTEAFNANQIARTDAASNAEFALRGIEADTAAQRNNINSALFVKPGTSVAKDAKTTTKKNGKKTTKKNINAGVSGKFGSSGTYSKNKATANIAKVGGYLMPDNAQYKADNKQKANKVSGKDYFANLLNQYTNRS